MQNYFQLQRKQLYKLVMITMELFHLLWHETCELCTLPRPLCVEHIPLSPYGKVRQSEWKKEEVAGEVVRGVSTMRQTERDTARGLI